MGNIGESMQNRGNTERKHWLSIIKIPKETRERICKSNIWNDNG